VAKKAADEKKRLADEAAAKPVSCTSKEHTFDEKYLGH
jgi:hypothetical protein